MTAARAMNAAMSGSSCSAVWMSSCTSSTVGAPLPADGTDGAVAAWAGSWSLISPHLTPCLVAAAMTAWRRLTDEADSGLGSVRVIRYT